MRARFLNEKFTKESDPISDLDIGISTQIKKKYNQGTPGYYLIRANTKYEKGWAFDTEANYTDVENAKFLMYDSDDDEPFREYLESILGEWSMKNSNKWSKYSIIFQDEEAEEIYGF